MTVIGQAVNALKDKLPQAHEKMYDENEERNKKKMMRT